MPNEDPYTLHPPRTREGSVCLPSSLTRIEAWVLPCRQWPLSGRLVRGVWCTPDADQSLGREGL